MALALAIATALLLLAAPAGAQTAAEAPEGGAVEVAGGGAADSGENAAPTSSSPAEAAPLSPVADAVTESVNNTVNSTGAAETSDLPVAASTVTSEAVDVVEKARRGVDETAPPVVDVVETTPIAKADEIVRDLAGPAERSLQQASAKLGDADPTPASTAAPASGSAATQRGEAFVEPGTSKGPLPSPRSPLNPRSGAGLEPLRASAAAGDRGPSAAHPPLAAMTPGLLSLPMTLGGSDVLLSNGGSGGLEEPAPVEGGGPFQVPEMLSAAASGLGGSTFIPIAALLALLALVAPAIVRRLREMADLSPPLPFACVLERPG